MTIDALLEELDHLKESHAREQAEADRLAAEEYRDEMVQVYTAIGVQLEPKLQSNPHAAYMKGLAYAEGSVYNAHSSGYYEGRRSARRNIG